MTGYHRNDAVAAVAIATAITRDGNDNDWHARAACIGLGWVMYPAERSGRHTDYRDALAVCATCPADVRLSCLRAAIDGDEQHGVWGATTPEQRQALVARMRKAEAS